MRFEKGNKVGVRFSSDNQPKKNGRKPSLYKQLKKLTGKSVGFELEKEDYLNIIRFLMEQDGETLEKLVIYEDPNTGQKTMNPKTPIWVVNICSALNADAKHGRTTTVEMVFDRVFGKATENVNLNDNTDISQMSSEEVDRELALITAQLKSIEE